MIQIRLQKITKDD